MYNKNKNITPYWNNQCEDLNSNLWIPTNDILQNKDSNIPNILNNSWFSTILYNFNQEKPDLQNTNIFIPKSKKIRIYPNSTQKKIFNNWFGCSRYTYNKTVEYLKQPETKANWKAIKTDLIQNLPNWSQETPYQIKSISVRDACKATSNAKKKFIQTKEPQTIHFKSKKNPKQSCFIPKSALTDKGLYYTISGCLKISEKIPDNFSDSRLTYENGRWFIVIPYKVKQKISDNQGKIVALDPGIRSFISFFSPENCGKLGVHDFSRIQRLCSYLDKLISKKSKSTSKRKQSIQKAINKLRWKIKDLVTELHHKVAKFLVDNFDIILIPTFETSKMVSRGSRKIQKKSVRNMLTFSHYQFKMFLKHKALEYGKTVIECNEAWTSKTISWTGEIVNNLGGRKEIKSKIDGRIMDRDINGARGSFLRALVDTPELLARFVSVC